jgi:hypothetical protein
LADAACTSRESTTRTGSRIAHFADGLGSRAERFRHPCRQVRHGAAGDALSKAAELISAQALLRDLVERGIEPQPEGLRVLEQPRLLVRRHARLDPLHQRLLLLGDEAADVDAREAWNLQWLEVQPGDARCRRPSSSRQAPVSAGIRNGLIARRPQASRRSATRRSIASETDSPCSRRRLIASKSSARVE